MFYSCFIHCKIRGENQENGARLIGGKLAKLATSNCGQTVAVGRDKIDTIIHAVNGAIVKRINITHRIDKDALLWAHLGFALAKNCA